MDQEISLEGFRLMHVNENEILHERRKILGLTQQKVADRAKIPLQSYQHFESGKRNIMRASFSIACRVIEALEMNISDFYHAKGDIGFAEETYVSPEGERYKKTGKLVSDEIEE